MLFRMVTSCTFALMSKLLNVETQLIASLHLIIYLYITAFAAAITFAGLGNHSSTSVGA